MTDERRSALQRHLDLVLRAFALIPAVALATPALAGGFLDNSKPEEPVKHTWAVPAKRMPVEGDGTDAMVARLENARMRVEESQQNVETARFDLGRARTRRYPRGDKLKEIQDRVVDMVEERDAARSDFVELVTEARAAGVPAGTLMPYMDLSDEIESQSGDQ